jgi:hypothetical protein
MMSLREYRNKAAHLADFLPWAALVGEGVVLNKDGSFQRTARFRGPDLDSATHFAGSVRAGRSSSKRSGRPRSTIPRMTFPIPCRRWSIWNGANSSARKARISRAPII